MDQSIELLTSNPVYMAVAVVLALLILVGVIKKLIKFVLVVSALLVLWVAYMVWSGEDVTVESLKEGFQSGIENIKEKIKTCDGLSLRTAKLPGEVISFGKKLKIHQT